MSLHDAAVTTDLDEPNAELVQAVQFVGSEGPDEHHGLGAQVANEAVDQFE